MKNINQNPQYIAASETLAQLDAALSNARAEEARLLDAMAKTPGASANPIQAALNLLAGREAQRTDSTGLNQSLDAVRVTIATLTPGLEQQRATIATLTAELSAQVCTDAAPSHGKAAHAIAAALEELRGALKAEADLRAGIEALGYRCNLQAHQSPAFDFEDSHSVVQRFMRDCAHYSADAIDATSGALDKESTVRLLTRGQNGAAGDVVRLPGRVARVLLRAGHAEYSSAKPSLAPTRNQSQAVI